MKETIKMQIEAMPHVNKDKIDDLVSRYCGKELILKLIELEDQEAGKERRAEMEGKKILDCAYWDIQEQKCDIGLICKECNQILEFNFLGELK